MLLFTCVMSAFHCCARLRGFNSFLPLSALRWLNPSELENMLRGQVIALQARSVPLRCNTPHIEFPSQVPSFSMTDLMACLKPNHGYGESLFLYLFALFLLWVRHRFSSVCLAFGGEHSSCVLVSV
jgi:hypothetical protein